MEIDIDFVGLGDVVVVLDEQFDHLLVSDLAVDFVVGFCERIFSDSG